MGVLMVLTGLAGTARAYDTAPVARKAKDPRNPGSFVLNIC